MKITYDTESASGSVNINLNNLLWRSHLYYTISRMQKKNDSAMECFKSYLVEMIESNPLLLKTLIALTLYDNRGR